MVLPGLVLPKSFSPYGRWKLGVFPAYPKSLYQLVPQETLRGRFLDLFRNDTCGINDVQR